MEKVCPSRRWQNRQTIDGHSCSKESIPTESIRLFRLWHINFRQNIGAIFTINHYSNGVPSIGYKSLPSIYVFYFSKGFSDGWFQRQMTPSVFPLVHILYEHELLLETPTCFSDLHWWKVSIGVHFRFYKPPFSCFSSCFFVTRSSMRHTSLALVSL